MAQIHWLNAVNGNFNLGSRWTGGTVPGSADDAILDAAGASFTVTASTAETVSSLQTSANAILSIGAGVFTATNGSGAGADAGEVVVRDGASFAIGGAFDNTGVVLLKSVSTRTNLIINSDTTLTGAGSIELGDQNSNFIYGKVASDTLTNVDNTISGSGQFGGDQLTLVNGAAGVIDATGTNNSLFFDPSGTAVNSGLIEATGSAGLVIFETTLDDTSGGRLFAESGSDIKLIGDAVVSGGTLSTSGTASINVVEAEFTGIAGTIDNEGQVDIDADDILNAQGAIDNAGTISLSTTGSEAELEVLTPGLTLSGGGAVTLDGAGSEIAGATKTSTLTNVDNTISGSGALGAGALTIANGVAGVIDADGVGGGLTIDATGGLANSGLIESSGGTLTLVSTTVTDAVGGVVKAAAGAIDLSAAKILAGDVSVAAGAGITAVSGSNTLEAASIANSGTVSIDNKALLLMTGVVGGLGAIDVTSTGAGTILEIGAGGMTLTGGGDLALSGVGARVVGATSGSTLSNVDDTISGRGRLGFGRMTLVNETDGVVDANVSKQALFVDTLGKTLTNAGLLEATGSGELVITSTSVDNSSGGSIVGTSGRVILEGSQIIGGALSTAGSGNIICADAESTLDGAGAEFVSLHGRLTIDPGVAVALEGSIVNAGTMLLDGSSKATKLVIEGAVTLSGGGTVELSASTLNAVTATATATFDNVDNRFTGSGTIGDSDLTLTNGADGVFIASRAKALILSTGANTIVNDGVLEAGSGGGGLQIASALDNLGELIASVGTLTVKDAVTGSGGATIAGGGTIIFEAAFSENVKFGSSGELTLFESQSYGGTITGFSKTAATKLDLRDITFKSGVTEATYSSVTGVLTVSEGAETATIKLAGNYSGSTFHVASDGHGGTVVTDGTSKAKAIGFRSAAAALSPSGPALAGSQSVHASTTAVATLVSPLGG